ncbi:hypothetical protein PHJA_000718100 [Phtheirospermum japonicum]|uniref:FLZ-type domain-containing protein n=1 Tax=Phtheirospermum japonicum TaxID=374723 RepID=A0A830BMA0_9LAMI|nr:hypothetical protein PHJA_000718100 [Phtheirospermum japonicum]
MFSIIWSKKKGSFLGSCKGSDDEGLRLILRNGNSNNVVVKPIFLFSQIVKPDYCYLKSCHLCHKPLSLDKEIYMYRGDLGFCSVECRDRQIYMDETKEIEISTQKMLSSFRQRNRCHGGGGRRCETRQLLEDFRKRRHPFSSQKDPVIFL